MTILHLSWGLSPTNGAANIARMILSEQKAAGHAVALKSSFTPQEIASCDELWCHCGWYWRIWRAVALAKRLGKTVRWMPECCYDPVRLEYHGWKKRLVGSFERCALRRCDRLVATCEAEADWIRAYVGKDCPPVDVTDIRRFFTFPPVADVPAPSAQRPLRVLYLGRQHPLKGTAFLEEAVRRLNASADAPRVDLRLVSDKTGAALEAEWARADVLCLPTLSDNFGLVVAEALSRGKPVITTDGAPAWENQRGVRYLKGYRDGSPERRVALLCEALESGGYFSNR